MSLEEKRGLGYGLQKGLRLAHVWISMWCPVLHVPCTYNTVILRKCFSPRHLWRNFPEGAKAINNQVSFRFWQSDPNRSVQTRFPRTESGQVPKSSHHSNKLLGKGGHDAAGATGNGKSWWVIPLPSPYLAAYKSHDFPRRESQDREILRIKWPSSWLGRKDKYLCCCYALYN